MEAHLANTQRIETRLPLALLIQAERLVGEGWAINLDTLLAEALRRYLDTHTMAFQEAFFREDVTWGLRGKD